LTQPLQSARVVRDDQPLELLPERRVALFEQVQ
jgi:hypothetical protein